MVLSHWPHVAELAEQHVASVKASLCNVNEVILKAGFSGLQSVKNNHHDLLEILSSIRRLRIEFRPTALSRYHAHTRWTLPLWLDLDLDLDLWPRLSISGELKSWPTHIQKLKFSQFKDRVETNGQTDGRTLCRLPTLIPTNAIEKIIDHMCLPITTNLSVLGSVPIKFSSAIN